MSVIGDFIAYVKQAWANKPSTSTPLSAERLTHIEDGIKANSDAIEAISKAVISNIVNDPDKIASMAVAYSLQEQITKLNSDKIDKGSDSDDASLEFSWKFISDDFMEAIRPFCNKGVNANSVVFFQTAGSVTNSGKVQSYSLGVLITNGYDRHCIIAHSSGVGNQYHINGFNQADTYSEDAWNWYGLGNTKLT